MLDWITQNSSPLNVLLQFLTLVVWVSYLQLLLNAYLRQRRPKILINRGAGHGVYAHCLVSNMGAEPIYVRSIIASLETESHRWTLAVTDQAEIYDEGWQPGSAGEATSQGSLNVGEFADIGTFQRFIDRVAWSAKAPSGSLDDVCGEPLTLLELTVVADYGSDDLLVGARRQFEVKGLGEDGKDSKASKDSDLVPTTVNTVQIRSRRRRQEIADYLQDYL